MYFGVDVSYHDGEILWDAVRNAGVDFVVVRAGYGNNNVDDMAHKNALNCNALDIPVGIYWFSYAYNTSMAKKEAEYALQFAKQHKISLPIFFDWEYQSASYAKNNAHEVNMETYNSMTKAFCETIENNGYYAGYYCNLDFFKNMVDPGILGKYDMWFARYNKSEPGVKNAIWQFTENNYVPGITGKVDCNLTRYDYPSIIKGAGLNHL